MSTSLNFIHGFDISLNEFYLCLLINWEWKDILFLSTAACWVITLEVEPYSSRCTVISTRGKTKKLHFSLGIRKKESSYKECSDTETVLTREGEELPSVEALGPYRLPEIRAFFSIFCGLLKSSEQISREMKIADWKQLE